MAALGVRCPNCNTINRPGARFCSQCRTQLEVAVPVPAGIRAGPPTNPSFAGIPAGPPTNPASSYQVPEVMPRSEGRSLKGVVVAILVFALVLAAAGFWYFNQQGSSLSGLPLVGGLSSTAVPAAPTLFAPPSTLLSSGPPATLLAGVPATLVAQVPGLFKTSTPGPSPTRVPGAASALALTPSPVPDAQVVVDSGNLRAGPATVFDIIGVLHKGDPLKIQGRNLTGDWLHVQTQTGQPGWVSTTLVKLNIPLANIPVDSAIPTPPPAPPPAPQAMPGSQGCPPSPALVSLSNRGGAALIIVLQGARNYIVNLGPGQTTNMCLTKGPYHFLASTTSPGSVPEQGDMVFLASSPVCWSLPAGAAPPCNAPADEGSYTSPPTGDIPMPPGLN